MTLLDTPPGQQPTRRMPKAKALKMEHMDERIGYTRHDDKLCAGTDEDVPRSARQDAEVVGGKRQTHRQHDDP